MRLLLATDARTPQINGVVVSIRNTLDCLRHAGHEVALIEPGQFRCIPCPTYPKIRPALRPARGVIGAIESFAPDAIHIATKGPLGLAARRYCVRNGRPFTTAYHTQFPQFPSLTDTFGLVLAEAMACGTPVAAFPVTGPIDVVTGQARRRARRRPALDLPGRAHPQSQ